jgi:hypothetical protein
MMDQKAVDFDLQMIPSLSPCEFDFHSVILSISSSLTAG